ncbi:hypothetical protein EJ02DRAFT_131635 [Clathrospora elynae]|uniref:Zn(2)-C6 fungal-type domain-containing protein n=1 Tax=Clathrospora elynae TaxID=706981 RepID=A0A6A5S3Y2_9PLEO|nr:hypothetical protein EJ02DRAFT_131635 [Clathrospora elynae]
MQDGTRSELNASSYGSHSKVAIPRLPYPKRPPPPTPRSRQRDRVQRACQNCRKRKIKCSGGHPHCNYCEKTGKTCIYELPRKDRLATAADRNQQLESLLKDLSLRVGDDDRRRIEDALQDSDGEVASPVSISSPKATTAQPQHESRHRPFASGSSHVPSAPETSPTSDRSSLPRLDGVDPEAEFVKGGGADSPEVVEAGFLGQVSEVQWLQSLWSRVQNAETVSVRSVDGSISHTSPPSTALDGNQGSLSSAPLSQIALTNFYHDEEGVKLGNCGNPFELPPEHTAGLLFQCFLKTVQTSFPLLPATLEGQLHQYYDLVRNGQSIHCPDKWFALVNLVFAIGAKFSHLISAEWRANDLDHIIYFSRAFQLLSMNDTIIVLSTPDLAATQAAGLFAFYYMIVGHVNRAWVMVGTALRSAFSLGLHVHDPDVSIPPAIKQSMARTWWSLHALESLLSSITGRPSIISNEDITTPLPSIAFGGQSQSILENRIDPVFMNADTNLNLLTQQVISKLYTQRRSTPSWVQIQKTIISLVADLDQWAVESIPHFHVENWNWDYAQQRNCLLLKLQYYRLKTLTTRPSLRRIERCFEAGTDDYTAVDQSVAEACIQAAQGVASLLAFESDVKALYEKGPWWSIVHNIMQALAILMNAMACPQHFKDSTNSSAQHVRQLVGRLRGMRETNSMAARAYQVLYSIVKTSRPHIWDDISDAFPDDMTILLQQPASGKIDLRYMPWPGHDRPSEVLFRYELDGFGNYQFHLL